MIRLELIGLVPFEFIENGEYKGIAADYLALISEKPVWSLKLQKV